MQTYGESQHGVETIKEVSSELVELLMLVTERVTEVIDTTSDSIEVEVNETVTASTNIWKIN